MCFAPGTRSQTEGCPSGVGRHLPWESRLGQPTQPAIVPRASVKIPLASVRSADSRLKQECPDAYVRSRGVTRPSVEMITPPQLILKSHNSLVGGVRSASPPQLHRLEPRRSFGVTQQASPRGVSQQVSPRGAPTPSKASDTMVIRPVAKIQTNSSSSAGGLSNGTDSHRLVLGPSAERQDIQSCPPAKIRAEGLGFRQPSKPSDTFETMHGSENAEPPTSFLAMATPACAEPRIADTSLSADGAIPTPPLAKTPRLAKFGKVVLAVVRLEFMASRQSWHSEIEGMLQMIRVALSNDKAYKSACEEVFDRFKEDCPLGYSWLPLSKVEQVLRHWLIPSYHVPMFWAILRKSDRLLEERALPYAIDKDTFSLVLFSFLRRMRSRYTLVAKKENFILRNQLAFENEYLEKDVIGSGSFGECFWAEHLQTKRLYACKRICLTSGDVDQEEVEAELEVMQKLDHPNLLRIYEWFETDSMFVLVLQPAFGGDLKKLLSREKAAGRIGLSESLVRQVTVQALHALAYMHSNHYIHRDIKPANMLLARELPMPHSPEHLSDVHVLLADFGLSAIFGEDMKVAATGPTTSQSLGSSLVKRRASRDRSTKRPMVSGTLAFMAPEVLKGSPTKASDIWALGISVFQLLCKQRLVIGDSLEAVHDYLENNDLELKAVEEKGVSEDALQFLTAVLKKEESQRPHVQELLRFSWFSECLADIHGNTDVLKGQRFRRMSRTRYANTFTKLVSYCSALQSDSSRIADLNKAFKAIDKDGQGTLTLDELAEGLKVMGLAGDDADASALFDAIDLDHDGHVNYSEFVASLLSTKDLTEGDLLERAFRIFDSDGNGSITTCELRAMLIGAGKNISDILPEGLTVDDILADIDTDGDRCISYEEFQAYFYKERSDVYRRNSAAFDADMIQNLARLRKASRTSGEIRQDNSASNSSDNSSLPDNEPLKVVFEKLAGQLRAQYNTKDLPDKVSSVGFEVLCDQHACRLAKEHWLVNVNDLVGLQTEDWFHLGLPLKLQNMLKSWIGVAGQQPQKEATNAAARVQVNRSSRCLRYSVETDFEC